jgi:hypothetical protein
VAAAGPELANLTDELAPHPVTEYVANDLVLSPLNEICKEGGRASNVFQCIS